MSAFDELVEKRRSIYALGDKEILPKQQIVEIVRHAAKHCPSAFNSQSARTAILFGGHHQKLWQIVLEALKPLTPPDKFAKTEEKILSFAAGGGTILFFEDEQTTEDLQAQFPLYKDNFPKWALQSNGMLEYLIWLKLAENDIGASLQHYNPLIDAAVAKQWSVPQSWKLLAQMPFGSIKAPAGAKDFLPLDGRVKAFA